MANQHGANASDGYDRADVLEERALNLAAGVVGLPATLGGLRFGAVPSIKRSELLYDSRSMG